MIDHLLRFTVPAAYALLPPAMASPAATALLLAIGLQESRFQVRQQQGGGPAQGFWQFEHVGVRGVLRHSATRALIGDVLRAQRYEPGTTGWSVTACATAIAHHDTLACAFARLLLWTLPAPLSGPADVDGAWQQYLEAWRPGKPHRETWDGFYAAAWRLVTGPPPSDGDPV